MGSRGMTVSLPWKSTVTIQSELTLRSTPQARLQSSTDSLEPITLSLPENTSQLESVPCSRVSSTNQESSTYLRLTMTHKDSSLTLEYA